MDYHHILIIKSDADSFERFYNGQMKQIGVDVDSFEEYMLYSRLSGKRYASISKFFIFFKQLISGQWRKRYRDYSTIIVFTSVRIVPFVWLIKRKHARIIFWQWNTMPSSIGKILPILKRFSEIWTFDQGDALKYAIFLNSQFYFKMNSEWQTDKNCKAHKTVFFVGKDKGRLDIILKLRKELVEQNIYCDFTVLKDKETLYESNDDLLTEQMVDYDEVIRRIKGCDAILDIGKEGQKGMTARVLEALFYEKKLITNNVALLNENYYSENNIFILGHDNIRNLNAFMEKPFVSYPQGTIDYYSFESWLTRFNI